MGWTIIISYCLYHIHKGLRTYAYIHKTYLRTFHKHTPHGSPPVSPKSHQGETPGKRENRSNETRVVLPDRWKTTPGFTFENWDLVLRIWMTSWILRWDFFQDEKTDVGCHWKMLFPVVGCQSVKDLKNSGGCELWCLGNLLLVCCLANTSRCLGGPEYLLLSSGF